MKANIMFVDEYSSSLTNGIGTFRNLFFQSMKNSASLSLLSLNYDRNLFECVTHPWGNEFRVGRVAFGQWQDYGDNILTSLSLWTKESVPNIFILNHSPAVQFIKSIRNVFPSAKIIFIIHNQGWCTPLLGNRGLLGRIMRDDSRTVNKLSPDLASFIKSYCTEEQEIYSSVNKVVALSRATAETLLSVYSVPESKIKVIPNAMPTHRRRLRKNIARKMLGLSADKSIVMFCGRPILSKGVEAFLEVALMNRNNEHLTFVLAGSIAEMSPYGKTISQLGGKLILTGHLSKSDLQKWYAAADVGMLCSYSEQCSFSALEMISNSMVIVSSNAQGLDEMFKNGQNAYVAKLDWKNRRQYHRNLNDALSLAVNMTQKERETMTRRCGLLLKGRYGIERLRKDYAQLITQME